MLEKETTFEFKIPKEFLKNGQLDPDKVEVTISYEDEDGNPLTEEIDDGDSFYNCCECEPCN